MASPTAYESVRLIFSTKDVRVLTFGDQTLRSVGTEASEASIFAPAYGRKDSANSTATTATAATTASGRSEHGPTRRATVPVVNRYTHCGRHSDQYLFGGWGDLVKGVFHKKE